jgi:hypothetical protein
MPRAYANVNVKFPERKRKPMNKRYEFAPICLPF